MREFQCSGENDAVEGVAPAISRQLASSAELVVLQFEKKALLTHARRKIYEKF